MYGYAPNGPYPQRKKKRNSYRSSSPKLTKSSKLKEKSEKKNRWKITVVLTPRNQFGNRSLNWSDSFLQVSHVWYMDSGCSRHMTVHMSFLSDFVKAEEGTVKFGGTNKGIIRSYGKLTNGNVLIKNVRYVEGLNHNLFSSSQFSVEWDVKRYSIIKTCICI